MAYNGVTNGEIDVDSPITTALMTKYRDNQTGFNDGTANADDAIIQRHLADDIVGQNELKTSTQSATYTGALGASTLQRDTFLLTSSYSLPPEYRSYTSYLGTPVGSYCYAALGYNQQPGNSSTYTAFENVVEAVRNNNETSSYTLSIDIDIIYVIASPPYDLGDGDVPLFVFALLDSDGNIKGVHSDVTPPWVYNGPTKATKDFEQDGKGYIREKTVNEESGEVETRIIELTQERKRADMDIIPHPFLSAKSDETVVLLDPVETGYLAEFKESGGRVSDLLIGDYLRLGQEVSRAGPSSVVKRSFNWKNSRSRAGEMIKDKRENRIGNGNP